MSIAIAVAIFTWTSDAAVARAGCGDDLMPLHTDKQAGTATAQESASETLVNSLVTPFPTRPCDGPGCGETPADRAGLAAVPQSDRSGTGGAALAGTDSSAVPPMIIDRSIAESEGKPSFLSAGVFRPPSAPWPR